MKSPLQQTDWFLNRGKHLTAFESEVLAGGVALVYCGEEGLGKSALLERFKQSASEKGVGTALTSFSPSHPVDAIALMHQLDKKLASDAFRSFRELLDKFREIGTQVTVSVPAFTGTISIAERANFVNSSVRDIIGQQIVVQSVSLDKETMQSLRAQWSTEASIHFLSGLMEASKQRKIVLLFDAIHLAQAEIYRWIWEELLPMISTGKLPNVGIVATCGAERPTIDGKMASTVKLRNLEPLSLEYIVEYVISRSSKVDRGMASGFAAVGLASFRGNLRMIATALDSWTNYIERQSTNP